MASKKALKSGSVAKNGIRVSWDVKKDKVAKVVHVLPEGIVLESRTGAIFAPHDAWHDQSYSVDDICLVHIKIGKAPRLVADAWKPIGTCAQEINEIAYAVKFYRQAETFTGWGTVARVARTTAHDAFIKAKKGGEIVDVYLPRLSYLPTPQDLRTILKENEKVYFVAVEQMPKGSNKIIWKTRIASKTADVIMPKKEPAVIRQPLGLANSTPILNAPPLPPVSPLQTNMPPVKTPLSRNDSNGCSPSSSTTSSISGRAGSNDEINKSNATTQTSPRPTFDREIRPPSHVTQQTSSSPWGSSSTSFSSFRHSGASSPNSTERSTPLDDSDILGPPPGFEQHSFFLPSSDSISNLLMSTLRSSPKLDKLDDSVRVPSVDEDFNIVPSTDHTPTDEELKVTTPLESAFKFSSSSSKNEHLFNPPLSLFGFSDNNLLCFNDFKPLLA